MQDVSKTQLAEWLAGVNQYGALAGGGVTRLALSDEDIAAQQYIMEQMEHLGLQVRRDAVGNIIARREGTEALPAVAMGSHLDTVVQGGHFDGVAGVVAALEVVAMLQDEALRHPLEVIVFMSEESAPFGYATIGSKLACGKAMPKDFAKPVKAGASTYVEALQKRGFDPERYREALLQPENFKAFFELHIEQGKVLYEAREQIGIVENIAAPTRFKVTVEGLADHSGATPMNQRRDALVSAAKLVLAVQDCGLAYADEGTVATVGVVDVEPGTINVIPGKVTMLVDLRGVVYESVMQAFQDFKEVVREVAEEDGVLITVDMLSSDEPVPLSSELADVLEAAAEARGVRYRRMNSGAGHDSMHMAGITPTSMVFIPCKDGISHNPAEFAELNDLAEGTAVLAAAVLACAK